MPITSGIPSSLSILGSAGVEAAMSMLAEDDNEYDADDEDWAKFSEYMMVASASLEGMTIQGNITDECSKLDINSLVELDSGDRVCRRMNSGLHSLKD